MPDGYQIGYSYSFYFLHWGINSILIANKWDFQQCFIRSEYSFFHLAYIVWSLSYIYRSNWWSNLFPAVIPIRDFKPEPTSIFKSISRHVHHLPNENRCRHKTLLFMQPVLLQIWSSLLLVEQLHRQKQLQIIRIFIDFHHIMGSIATFYMCLFLHSKMANNLDIGSFWRRYNPLSLVIITFPLRNYKKGNYHIPAYKIWNSKINETRRCKKWVFNPIRV
jgi:hypothetical protein